MEFDPAKDALNIRKHGISLARAGELDVLTAAVVIDDRKDYGEPRYRAFGPIDGRLYCLVFTIRQTSERAISLRPAKPRTSTTWPARRRRRRAALARSLGSSQLL